MAKQPTEQQLAGASLKRQRAKQLSNSGAYALSPQGSGPQEKGSVVSLLVTMGLAFLLA